MLLLLKLVLYEEIPGTMGGPMNHVGDYILSPVSIVSKSHTEHIKGSSVKCQNFINANVKLCQYQCQYLKKFTMSVSEIQSK